MLLTSHMKWFSPSVSPSDSMRPDSWTKCADDEKHEAYTTEPLTRSGSPSLRCNLCFWL
uniref:Uncharacterized protein n=1 Tax=Astatotilapia calliptera TaxID=8154 RepID=A0AAX7T4J6_ASTCA